MSTHSKTVAHVVASAGFLFRYLSGNYISNHKMYIRKKMRPPKKKKKKKKKLKQIFKT